MAKSKDVEAVTDVTDTLDALNSAFGVEQGYVPDSVEDLDAYFAQQGGIIEIAGSPYTLLSKSDKAKLEGRRFMIVDTRWYASKQYGNDVVAVAVMTAEPIDGETKFLFNDGSTGVCQQLKGIVASTGRRGGFLVPRGLRASNYTYVERDFDGVPIPGKPEIEATTYYIA